MPTPEQARAWLPLDDPVHDYDHVMRVYSMAEIIAKEEGADLEIVRAAALLHDAVGSTPNAQPASHRNNHHGNSAEYALVVLKQEGWSDDRIKAVQHCIRAHRFRFTTERPETIEAKVLYDADKLDVLGAIGAARTIAYAILAGQPVYAQPSEKFLKTGTKEPGEPHSSYHEFLFKLIKVKDTLHTETARRIAAARHDFLVAYYQELVAEASGEK
ncbi:MAG: HD domain-containing protein [Anaerolineaceae bacterium]|nr:HD domain-containing protein [Anaerolineaceae bacterium]